jgi:hypothetical protein
MNRMNRDWLLVVSFAKREWKGVERDVLVPEQKSVVEHSCSLMLIVVRGRWPPWRRHLSPKAWAVNP